jgi:uncharacterized protein affecting Mg2+/Co2+ transport
MLRKWRCCDGAARRKTMEGQGPSVGEPPTATTNEEEEFSLFVGAATEVPEIRWPKVMLEEEEGVSDE